MAEENITSEEISPSAILTQSEANAGYKLENFDAFQHKKIARRYGQTSTRLANSGRGADKDRTKLYIAQMKATIANLWNIGIRQEDIAEMVSDEFGLVGPERLTGTSVNYHVKKLLEYWREQSLLNIDERQAAVLARYDQIDALATQAYFLSMQGKVTRHEEHQIKNARQAERIKDIREELRNDNVKLTKKERKELLGTLGELEDALSLTEETIKEFSRMEETAPGDVKFLRIMIECNDRRASIWGLNKNKDVNTGDQELAKLSDEQRQERLAAILHAASTRKTGDKGMLAPASPLGGFNNEEEEVHEEQPDEIQGETVPEIEGEEDDFWDF